MVLAVRSLIVPIVLMLISWWSIHAATLRFSLPAGVYTNDISVRLLADPANTPVRFTLDGSEPTASSPSYSGPVAIANSVLLTARLFPTNGPAGPILSENYIVLDRNLIGFNSNLPLVILNTLGRGISHESKNLASICIIGPHGDKQRVALANPPDFEGAAIINVRGHSSLRFPKQSLSVRTKGPRGNGLKPSILGLPSDSDWALYAPYPDKTLLRDVLAYELSREMGHYAPRTRFVEVFITAPGHKLSTRDYVGVYVLEERIKRGRNRVNIQKLTPEQQQEPEMSGGYIFKKDHEDGRSGGFRTRSGIHFFFVDPKDEQLTKEQKRWLASYVGRFERVLTGPDFKDPDKGYAAYIDPDSFIDFHWIVELSKNIDGFRFSNYLQKDRNGKIKTEPIWDWNLSFGNANYLEGSEPRGWYSESIPDQSHVWYDYLFQDVDFQQKYVDRWFQLRTNQFSISNILAKVDQFSGEVSEAQQRNFQRWPILGEWVWPNSFVGQTYAEEVNWMKGWIRQRITWIDLQFLKPPLVNIRSSPPRLDPLLTLKASNGDVYFTVDGSDPRAPGGAISPNAKQFAEPIATSLGLKVMARTHLGDTWSAPVDCSHYQ